MATCVLPVNACTLSGVFQKTVGNRFVYGGPATVGGNTSIGSAEVSEDAWTLHDPVADVTFDVISIEVRSGDAIG